MNYDDTSPRRRAKPTNRRWLDNLDREVPWERLRTLVEPFYRTSGANGGEPQGELLKMLRVWCLQECLALSHTEMEEALRTIEPIRRFAGFALHDKTCPDAMAIRRFYELLHDNGLTEKILALVGYRIFEAKKSMLQLSEIHEATPVRSAPDLLGKPSTLADSVPSSLIPPEKVTLPWLFRYVPVKLWFSFVGLLLACIGFGANAHKIPFVRELLVLEQGDQVNKKTDASVQLFRASSKQPGIVYVTDPSLQEAKRTINSKTSNGTDYSKAGDDAGLRQAILQILNYLETVASGLEHPKDGPAYLDEIVYNDLRDVIFKNVQVHILGQTPIGVTKGNPKTFPESEFRDLMKVYRRWIAEPVVFKKPL